MTWFLPLAYCEKDTLPSVSVIAYTVISILRVFVVGFIYLFICGDVIRLFICLRYRLFVFMYICNVFSFFLSSLFDTCFSVAVFLRLFNAFLPFLQPLISPFFLLEGNLFISFIRTFFSFFYVRVSFIPDF